MKQHINTKFKLFILERFNNTKKFSRKDQDLEEAEPDELELTDIEDEPTEDDISVEFDRIMDDEDEKDKDDLIEELHRKYKTLRRQYENRVHQRKSRKTIR